MWNLNLIHQMKWEALKNNCCRVMFRVFPPFLHSYHPEIPLWIPTYISDPDFRPVCLSSLGLHIAQCIMIRFVSFTSHCLADKLLIKVLWSKDFHLYVLFSIVRGNNRFWRVISSRPWGSNIFIQSFLLLLYKINVRRISSFP